MSKIIRLLDHQPARQLPISKFQLCCSGILLTALILAGCQAGENRQGNQGDESPAPQAFPSPTIANGEADQARRNTTPILGLIQPTDADRRVAQLKVGKADPFAPLTAQLNVSPRSLPSQSAPQLSVPLPPPPPVIGAGGLPEIRVTPTRVPAPPRPIAQPTIAQAPQLPVPAAPTPQNSLPALPPAPPPAPTATDLAQQVRVVGVVQTRNKLSAIIEIPQERSSRAVVAGDYLANGAILVKRIQMNANQEPIVILEANGVEITRIVSAS